MPLSPIEMSLDDIKHRHLRLAPRQKLLDDISSEKAATADD